MATVASVEPERERERRRRGAGSRGEAISCPPPPPLSLSLKFSHSSDLGLPSMATPEATATSYWCYRCTRFIQILPCHALTCPTCDGGFLEALDPSPTTLTDDATSSTSSSRHRRSGDRSPFNPVIVLRSPTDRPAPAAFELFYDDGAGSGLRPLPSSMSEFLMGSGFDRLLDQLSQINGARETQSCENPPASKAAIESMPTINIAPGHVKTDSHCAVCKELFELGTEAREMPCKHIYHQDCILPWLLVNNSCPVCRHEMPSELRRGRPESDGGEVVPVGGEEDAVGLTIWRLPGGGFAVGRFSGGRREGERELPVVYTEMDGGFNSGGAPRRISWSQRGNRSRQSGGIGQVFRNFISSFFTCFGSSTPPSSSRARTESVPSTSRRSPRAPIANRSRRRRRSSWSLEDGTGIEIARW